MPFFEAIDEDQTIEGHAKEVTTLQDGQARTMLDYYKDARRELIDKLMHARYESFTAQHLRGVLAQVSAAMTAINSKLQGSMEEGSLSAAMEGVKHLVAEIHKFSHKFTGAVQPISINQVQVAMDTKNFLINQYQASMDAYDSVLRAKMARGLAQAAIQEAPYGEVVHKIGQFMQGQEWEAHRIVRTELHHIYSLGKLNGMKITQADSIPDLKKALYHPMDSRTGQDSIELAEMNPIKNLDEPFTQTYTPIKKNGKRGKPQQYVFMTPPDRPNDRAILIPYRDTWGESISRREGPLNKARKFS